MAEHVNWSFTASIQNGPAVAGSDTFEADAYDKLSVTLPAGELDTKVDILPPGSAGPVLLLVVKASIYSDQVSFSTTGDGGRTVVLDGPLVLIGAGPAALLTGELKAVQFANGTAGPVTVDILVGRDATP